ncbi:hypothetical protein SAMN05421738_106182 [Algoriella xinjiangensis]|uniref:DUF3365 domain-containing protein n=1 Tax=Algoriella xinjiangensis TaxID=684065 RepID=A0A1I4W7C3_9FLAO|nr:hypothetical protein [Algoriella xinjiangensis]SFN09558.1 hypothetical protein SAMN05421738_106182 [Algoriella xinjiangensis]VDH15662.1 Uncharacterised protein [Algoriella xinjiangensis]
MKSKILIFLLIFIFVVNCKQKRIETENPQISEANNSIKNTKIDYGKNFFDFDEVDYYSIVINEDDATKLLDNHISKLDEKRYNLIMNPQFPGLLSEIKLIGNFQELGFKKSTIRPDKFSKLNKIFIEKSEQDGISAACIPIFRDILIFKKENKITGFTKICFDCHQYHIIGTNADTKNFGEGQDYEKLGEILYDK